MNRSLFAIIPNTEQRNSRKFPHGLSRLSSVLMTDVINNLSHYRRGELRTFDSI